MLSNLIALGLVASASAATAAEGNISACLSIEKSAPTAPPGLFQSIAAANTDMCTYTIPKSLSSAYASYTSAAMSWAKENESKLLSACPHPTGVTYSGPAITSLPIPTACKSGGNQGSVSAGGTTESAGGASETSGSQSAASSGGAASGATGASESANSAAAKSTSTAGAARETGIALAAIAAVGIAVAAL